MSGGASDVDYLSRLRAYCALIANTFTGSLDLLSGTGVKLSLEQRQTQQLSHTIEEKRDQAVRHQMVAGQTSGPKFRTESEDDLTFLRNWSTSPSRQRMQVHGPFGFGKSALMAALSVTLATEAIAFLKDSEDEDDNRIRIPLPVRLRDVAIAIHEDEDWPDILANAFKKYASGAIANERLTVDLILELNKTGRLVCMYDGHDELGEPLAGNVLRKIREFHGENGSYLLTSRDEVRYFPQPQRFSLTELSDKKIHALLDTLLGSDPSRRKEIDQRFKLLEPTIGSLLRRPLFLAVWAREAADTNIQPNELPRDVDQLMQLLTLHCFDRAGETLKSCPHNREEQEQALPALGHYLLADADSSFDDSPRFDADRAAIIAKRIPAKLAPDYIAADIRKLAHALGVLSSREVSGVPAYIASKIPITEYLVGRYLADLATGSHDHQRAFIEIMRLWCYRPRTYETIDYAVDRLTARHGGSKLLDDLEQWLVNASESEPTRAKRRGQRIEVPVPDCLVHPSAWCAMRIAAHPNRESARRSAYHNLQVTVSAAAQALADFNHVQVVWPGSIGNSTIESLVLAYSKADRQGQTSEWGWARVIEDAAKRVTETNARAVAEACITKYRDAGEQKWLWARAIGAAATRISRTDAGAMVKVLINSFNDSSKEKKLWALAIKDAAGRLSETDAGSVVEALIKSYDDAGDQKDAWAQAIRVAAESVPKTNAEDMLEAWISKYPYAGAQKDAWDLAIYAVAGLVSETNADDMVKTRTIKYLDAGEQKGAWALAICAAAGRVSETDARAVVEALIKSYAYAGDQKDAWTSAIYAAAGRVSETDARAVVEALVKGYADAVEREDGWKLAIYVAARSVSEAKAGDTVVAWIKNYADAGDSKNDWASAIANVAGRVCESDAGPVVGALITSFADAGEQKELWSSAIENAAGRLSETDAGPVVEALIKTYTNAGDQKDAWAQATKAAAGRVSETNAGVMAEAWISKYHDAGERKNAWVSAITGVAGRIPKSVARTVVELLIKSYAVVGEQKLGWAGAIFAVAERALKSDARSIVELLIKSYADANEQQWVWANAIMTTAGAVCETDAHAVVEALLESYADAYKHQSMWAGAIEAAAKMVSSADAAAMVDALIENCPDSSKEHWTWRNAIVAAAKRVSETDARAVVETWIKKYPHAGAQKLFILYAIKATSGRVSEIDAHVVAEAWIKKYTDASEPPWMWEVAIHAVVWRISTPTEIAQAVSRLSQLGWHDLAIATAVKADMCGLVAELGWQADAKGNATGKTIWNEGSVTPMLRSDDRLKLDPHESVVPNGLKKWYTKLKKLPVDDNGRIRFPVKFSTGLEQLAKCFDDKLNTHDIRNALGNLRKLVRYANKPIWIDPPGAQTNAAIFDAFEMLGFMNSHWPVQTKITTENEKEKMRKGAKEQLISLLNETGYEVPETLDDLIKPR